VTFSGVSRKAVAASLQSDLANAAKQLKLFNVENGTYPHSLDSGYCPTPPSSQYCLKASSGNSLEYTSPDPHSTFVLVATHDDIAFAITESTGIVEVKPLESVGAITGTPAVGSQLAAGAIDPSGATVTWKWQVSDSVGGPYVDIPGAMSDSYIPTIDDVDRYVRVVAAGVGLFAGSATSAPTAPILLRVVTIGDQVWIGSNLNLGVMIDSSSQPTDNNVIEKWCYDDDPDNCQTYGGLYSWHEAMQYDPSEGARGICPAGFHIPTDDEFKQLEMYLGMSQAQADDIGNRGNDEGQQLKDGGSSGFEAVLAGRIDEEGWFESLNFRGYLWTSSEFDVESAWRRSVIYDMDGVTRSWSSKTYGMSVRCLED
jgi:uncharacterized protein (TIGR02145 family)